MLEEYSALKLGMSDEETTNPSFRFHSPDLLDASEALEPQATAQLLEEANALVVYPDPPLAAEE